MDTDYIKRYGKLPAVADAIQLKETFWENENCRRQRVLLKINFLRDVEDAALRLDKFMPLIMRLFPKQFA